MKCTLIQIVAVLGLATLLAPALPARGALAPKTQNKLTAKSPSKTVVKRDWKTASKAEWKKILTPEQYRIMIDKGTEPAYTGSYWNFHEAGTYVCVASGAALFSSKDKFDSGTGWPSFRRPIDERAVIYRKDTSDGQVRTEVICAETGTHLGHVFDDGPAPTGKRFCINSAALRFVPSKKKQMR